MGCTGWRGTHVVSLSLSELLEVANDRGLMDWERQLARHATMENLDLEKVKAYLVQCLGSGHRVPVVSEISNRRFLAMSLPVTSPGRSAPIRLHSLRIWPPVSLKS